MAKVDRLLEKIVPQRYGLNLDVDMHKFTFRAYEEITFELTESSQTVVFHADGLKVTLAQLETGAKAAHTTYDSKAQTVTFEFEEAVAAGPHTLNVAFTGVVGELLHGFYRSSYMAGTEQKWLATTQFEAASAREAFICIDEPAAKAIFELSLTIPDNLTAISNAQVASEAPAGAGRKKVQFDPSPKMSTYLAAYIIGEFDHIEGTTPEGVNVRVYATPGQTGQLAFALDAAIRTLSFYNQYFGVAYPLPKLDMIAIPDFASGAMENWGAVTYRETALLLDPAKTSLANKQRVAEVVAHELAHQWFGNLVTMQWWNDIWLNEGFATWVASLAMDHLFPDWNVWTQFIQEEFAQAQELDGLANTHPIEVEIDDPRALDEIFDSISYAKGASVINMLHHYLGAEDFRRGLSDYLKKHSYANTVTHDLWKALGKASGKPVDEVMSKWTSRPGYPIVSFDDGQLRQARFYSSPREAAKAKLGDSELWPVPFTALLSDKTETEPDLVEASPADLPPEIMAADWFKPNPGQTAFYRTLYTRGMLDALAGPMHEHTLSATDRYGIVNDVFAAAEAGISDSEIAMTLVATLRKESDYVVWGGLTGGFGALDSIVEDENLRRELERFGLWLVQPNLERLGWEAGAQESSFDTLMRPVVLQQAARFDDANVKTEASKRFKAYLEGQPLNPDLRAAVLYTAARNGGADEYEAMLDRYRRESSPQVKMSLLGSLGRFRKPELIDRYLELAMSPDVRTQDLYIVLAYGFRNRSAREKTWQFVKDNWSTFVERYGEGGHMLERFPLYAAMGFATEAMAHEVKDFFESHPHPATKRPTAQAVESIQLKADWYTRDKLKIANYLEGWTKHVNPK